MSGSENTGSQMQSWKLVLFRSHLILKFSILLYIIGYVKWNYMPEAPREGLKPLVYHYYYYHYLLTNYNS